MGNVKVTVYGRVKPCFESCLTQEYEIKYGTDEDQITFFSPRIPSGKKSYRFKKIFGKNSTQEEVFDTVAKPVINSFLAGYNGTIFTYGQTGTGKTYTMSGELENWISPGLIPRAVEEIFRLKKKDAVISISYCEIYNEHVYDLIRVNRVNSDVRQVSLLEDSSGITHFRNLSVHLVQTADDALQLFIRGDANKMISETTSNARSSRSHVIFSIGLEIPHPTENKLFLKPVLYLVDLAGNPTGDEGTFNPVMGKERPEEAFNDAPSTSEKMTKCRNPANPLETRYINLSLHYLEQVLLALRQPGRNHIPYRNSLMTALLRNSLGGNCITTMIATLSMASEDLEESLQTCRFAERIALIKNEIKLTEQFQPQKEIDFLRKENEKLRAQLRLINCSQVTEELTEEDEFECQTFVKNFLQNSKKFELPMTDVRKIHFCFYLMKQEIIRKRLRGRTSFVTERETKILDVFKRNSMNGTDSLRTSSMLENSEKHNAKNDLRKRNHMSIPKVNITYDKEKFINKLAENDKKTYKKSSSKELHVIEPNSSPAAHSSVEFRATNSDSSTKIFQTHSHTIRVEEENKKENFLEPRLLWKSKTSKTPLKNLDQNTKITIIDNPAPIKSDFPENSAPSNHTLPETEVLFAGDDMAYTDEEENFSEIPVEKLSATKRESESTYTRVDISQSRTISSQSRTIISDSRTFSQPLPLTGDKEVDEEIIKFYRNRHFLLESKSS